MADVEVTVVPNVVSTTITAQDTVAVVAEANSVSVTIDANVTSVTVEEPAVISVTVEPNIVDVVVGDVPAHEALANPHPQYLTQAEADLLYTSLTFAPATTVETETTYGQDAAVGVSVDYSRADHTHGTPAEVTRATLGLATTDSPSFSQLTLSSAYPSLFIKGITGDLYSIYVDGDGNIGTELVI